MIALYIILSIILLIFILLHFSVVLSVDYTNNELKAKAKYLFFTVYPLKEKKTNKKRQLRKNKRKKKKLEKRLAKEKAKVEKLKKKQKAETSAEEEKNIGKPLHETVVNINPDEKRPEDVIKDKSDEKAYESIKEDETSAETEKEEKENKLFSKIDDLKDKWEDIKPYIPLGKKSVKKLIKAIRITDLKINIAVADEDAYECAMSYGKMNGIVYGALGLITSFFTVSINRVNITAKYNSSESEYAFSGKVKTRPSTIIALAVFILFKYIYTKLKLEKQKTETEM